MSLKDKIDIKNLPQHIAIIMDGNGRWAKMRGKHRVFGHEQGVISVRETAEAAAEIGVKFLTLYAFSTENWKRPATEVEALMKLLVQTIHQETKTLTDNDIRLKAIGDLDSLDENCRKELIEAMNTTASNKRMDLVLALSYSGRWELTETFKALANKVRSGILNPDDITQEVISNNLNTAGMPEPELLIRTSGECRISNFLIWQSAYTELYFTSKLWPDFRKEDLYEAIIDYQQRERRFGKVSEQIKSCR
ncbi:MAG: isoprenyl transferase [Bacteroidales bacterium]|jgi:undecaprenyl diphosphate synthase|nr:isoprenyl transferase [Bacteroidales bacterium]